MSSANPRRSALLHRVAVLVVAHNGRDDLTALLDSIRASDDSDLVRRIVVVDNASTDGTRDLVRTRYPEVDLVESHVNLGFAGGNNRGWRHVQATLRDVEFLFLLNQDTLVAKAWLAPLVELLDRQRQVAAVQPKILLYPRTELINTAGNRCHYLGFGLMEGYLEQDRAQFDTPAGCGRSIDSPSGAAVLLRAAVIAEVGLFDDDLFMYMEDVDLAWRLRLAGYDIRLESSGVVYHKYTPDAAVRRYYELERNRWLVLASCYRVPTLALLAPAWLAMELGQLAFAARRGLLRAKLRAMAHAARPSTWAAVARKRRAVRSIRKVGDRVLVRRFTGRIDSPTIDSALLRCVGNPLLAAYWTAVRPLILW